MACHSGCLIRGLSVVVATLLAGCTVVPRETQLMVTPGLERPAMAHIGNYQAAVNAIVSVMTEDLQIPLPKTSFTLFSYPYREAFAQGLTEKFQTDPTLAREIAQSALGRIRQTKEGKQMLVNAEILESLSWTARIHVFAHELTHIAQYELAYGALRGDLWLIEGFADWVAYRVLEVLGLDTLNRRRSQKIAQVIGKDDHLPLPSLSQMTSVEDWSILNTRYGSAVPYAQAFLATDLLIQQHGISSVIDYFRRVSSAKDRLENFEAAFGEELLAFEHEFSTYVEHLLSGSLPNAAAPAALPN
jgi:hypothetical protein